MQNICCNYHVIVTHLIIARDFCDTNEAKVNKFIAAQFSLGCCNKGSRDAGECVLDWYPELCERLDRGKRGAAGSASDFKDAKGVLYVLRAEALGDETGKLL